MSVYVSVTGFRPQRGIGRILRFWWHTWQSLRQARRAAGLVRVEVRPVAGYYHTLTVWADEASMRAYVRSGAHRRAMARFRDIGSGRTFGFASDGDPGWEAAYIRWQHQSREV